MPLSQGKSAPAISAKEAPTFEKPPDKAAKTVFDSAAFTPAARCPDRTAMAVLSGVCIDFRKDSSYTRTNGWPGKGERFGMHKKDPPNQPLTPIGQVLDTIIDQCRSDNRGGIAYLIRMWEKTIGPPISENARPFAVKGDLLLVHVSSSAWLHQLRFLKDELLAKFNDGLESQRIGEIKFKIGPL